MGEDFESVVSGLRYWLECQNLPTVGVTLRVVFPTWRDAQRAEACLKDALPHMSHTRTGPLPAGVAAKIDGIDVEFRVAHQSDDGRVFEFRIVDAASEKPW